MKLKLLLLSLLFAVACEQSKPTQPTESDVEYLHDAEKKLTDIIVLDIFTPPVASRIYVYPMLAAYEAGKFTEPGSKSITDQLHGFDKMPLPEAGKQYDFTVAALKALCTAAPKVIFSVKEIGDFEQKSLSELRGRMSQEVFERSVAFGQQVANIIIKRMAADQYNETRGMERFEVNASIAGRWVPTPPDYADGLEPYWYMMKPMVMDSSGQIRADTPEPYSEDPGSPFWKEVEEVYQAGKNLTEEEKDMAIFWDCNPFVSTHKGHLMFQDKKMTAGGHWMAICQQFLRKQNVGFYESLKAYALTSLAIYDGFISCWHEKYHTLRVRPETVISAKIDKDWYPYIISPSFPAYTSAHSTVSAASAEVLTGLFGDNQAYTDTAEKEYGLPVRSFASFREAALEASYSRVYGGIHYRSDCEKGNKQGTEVGQFILNKIKF